MVNMNLVAPGWPTFGHSSHAFSLDIPVKDGQSARGPKFGEEEVTPRTA